MDIFINMAKVEGVLAPVPLVVRNANKIILGGMQRQKH